MLKKVRNDTQEKRSQPLGMSRPIIPVGMTCFIKVTSINFLRIVLVFASGSFCLVITVMALFFNGCFIQDTQCQCQVMCSRSVTVTKAAEQGLTNNYFYDHFCLLLLCFTGQSCDAAWHWYSRKDKDYIRFSNIEAFHQTLKWTQEGIHLRNHWSLIIFPLRGHSPNVKQMLKVFSAHSSSQPFKCNK